jgi:hypothetical protein
MFLAIVADGPFIVGKSLEVENAPGRNVSPDIWISPSTV